MPGEPLRRLIRPAAWLLLVLAVLSWIPALLYDPMSTEVTALAERVWAHLVSVTPILFGGLLPEEVPGAFLVSGLFLALGRGRRGRAVPGTIPWLGRTRAGCRLRAG